MHRPSFLRAPVLASILAALAALVLAACGGDEESGDEGPDPATLVPADAPLYFEAVVQPEGEQEEDLNAALGKLLNTDDPGAMIRDAVESELEGEGISFSEDVDPWLGQNAGLFLTDFSDEDGNGAAIVAVTDEGAANDFIAKAVETGDTSFEEATYEGTTYQRGDDQTAVGIVGDFLVIGTEDGFQGAVDASGADSLADNAEASDALNATPEGSLFSAYLDTARVLDLAVDAGAVTRQDLEAATGGQLDALREGPVVVSADADADSMSVEFSGPAGEGETGTEIVSTLPADSWLAFGVPAIGESIAISYQNLLDGFEAGLGDLPGAELPGGQIPDVQAELRRTLGIDLAEDLNWAGDLGAFVRGTSLFDLGAGIVIETDDEQAAQQTVDQLRKALQRQPDLEISDTETGFQVQTGPAGAEVAVEDGQVVFAIAGATLDEVVSPSETLADDEAFDSATSALGDELTAAFYVAVPPIVSLVEGSGQVDPSFEQARPVLESISYLIAGSGVSDDRSVGRIVLGLQEGESSEGAAATITP